MLLRHSSSDEYQAAQATLARSFQGKFDKFVVPCVVASGDPKDRKGTEPLSFRCGALAGGRGCLPESHRPSCATNPDLGPRREGHSGWSGQDKGGEGGHSAISTPSPSQSSQHPVPGAVVSGGGAVHRGDLRQRQNHLQLR